MNWTEKYKNELRERLKCVDLCPDYAIENSYDQVTNRLMEFMEKEFWIVNYLVLGVIMLWCVSAYRKRYSSKPTDVLPGSRSAAMREILARASAKEPCAVEVLATMAEEANRGV